MKTGSRYEKILVRIHRRALTRILAALTTTLATGLILAFSAPSGTRTTGRIHLTVGPPL
jgi:hypothetical protein